MQQESSLFSQDDPSCSSFLPHQCKTQKNWTDGSWINGMFCNTTSSIMQIWAVEVGEHEKQNINSTYITYNLVYAGHTTILDEFWTSPNQQPTSIHATRIVFEVYYLNSSACLESKKLGKTPMLAELSWSRNMSRNHRKISTYRCALCKLQQNRTIILLLHGVL